MVERSQKLGILIDNAHRDLSKTSEIYCYIDRVIDHQKKYLSTQWFTSLINTVVVQVGGKRYAPTRDWTKDFVLLKPGAFQEKPNCLCHKIALQETMLTP